MRPALLAAAALLLAGATPAAASETIARSALTAGPVLAGGSVLWADAPSGHPRVLSQRGVVARWPRATTKDSGRTVAALAASADQVAAVVETCTATARSFGCAERAYGGRTGHFSPFGASLPRRGTMRCPGPRTPVSVAAGDGVTAVAETPSCQGIARAAAARSQIVVRRGAARWAIASEGATHVRIAGRYLAYLEGGRAVLYDLARRERVRTVADGAVGAVDVQRDGTLALVRTDRTRRCASVLRRDAATERRLACGLASARVAIAGGRVLVEREASLVLIGPRGRRVVARVPRSGAIGGFDLAGDRAVWAVGEPGGYQRIELQRL